MAGPDVGMNAVLLAGRWTPPVPRNNGMHVLLQCTLLAGAHLATLASKSLSNRLVAYRRHADEVWDPNEEIPKDTGPVHHGSANTVSVAALAQGASKSLSNRLASHHRRVDEGWDPNERVSDNVAVVPCRLMDTALVTGSAQGSGAEDYSRGSPTK